ncbi:hypothetical protein PIB30_087893 [Stylosanthes scabra]|uniref:Uncharacterized protein n=1 Tax=Stylosanthes scabra TaxID=79078 RepID=A0ABU6SU52_9FABA|nr:hypothetical protein [Stylosanthes scabra]
MDLSGESIKVADCPENDKLRNNLKNKTVAELKLDVKGCSLKTEANRVYFRRHFLLLVLKCFYLATTRAIVSEFHINAVVDVEDPSKIYWARLYICIQTCMGIWKNISGKSLFFADWSAAQLDEKATEEITRPSGLLNRAESSGVPYSSVYSNGRTQVKKKGTAEENTRTIKRTRKKRQVGKESNAKKISRKPTKGKTKDSSSQKRQALNVNNIMALRIIYSKVGGVCDTSGGHIESVASTRRRRSHEVCPSAAKKKTRTLEDTNIETTSRSEKVPDIASGLVPNEDVDGGGSAKRQVDIDYGSIPGYGTTAASPREHLLAMVLYESPVKPVLMEIPAPSFLLGLTQMQTPRTPPATPITEKRGVNVGSTQSADGDTGEKVVTRPLK